MVRCLDEIPELYLPLCTDCNEQFQSNNLHTTLQLSKQVVWIDGLFGGWFLWLSRSVQILITIRVSSGKLVVA
jgi:hypothetical protein